MEEKTLGGKKQCAIGLARPAYNSRVTTNKAADDRCVNAFDARSVLKGRNPCGTRISTHFGESYSKNLDLAGMNFQQNIKNRASAVIRVSRELARLTVATVRDGPWV